MANKLSKAQQEVVDKMREGWELWYSSITGLYWLRKAGKNEYIRSTTVRSLTTSGVIIRGVMEIGRLQVQYRLTEQYKNEQHKTESKMSTERLSAKDFLGLYLMDHPFPDDPAMIQAAEEYAAQEVEQHTKQLREEREQSYSYLTRLVEVFEHGLAVYPLSCLHRDGKQLLDQSNQQNERKDTICD